MNSPVESIESENTEFVIERTVASALEEEMSKLGNVLAKNWNFLKRIQMSDFTT